MTLSLPSLLFLGMGACVLLTGLVSYRLGDAALEGVTQPENNPTQKLVGKPRAADNEQTTQFTPINIAQVAKETRVYIQNQQKAPSQGRQSAPGDEKNDDTPGDSSSKKP